MILNGKKIGYLMLGGESFSADSAFPGFYSLPKLPNNNKSYPTYDLDENGSKFVPSKGTNSAAGASIDSQSSLIYSQIIIQGDKYICIRAIESYVIGRSSDIGVWVSDFPVWCKLSDLGGEMIPATGGVNSPSYILFIFNIKEVTPAC